MANIFYVGKTEKFVYLESFLRLFFEAQQSAEKIIENVSPRDIMVRRVLLPPGGTEESFAR